jgi:hypothetical protein
MSALRLVSHLADAEPRSPFTASVIMASAPAWSVSLFTALIPYSLVEEHGTVGALGSAILRRECRPLQQRTHRRDAINHSSRDAGSLTA